MILTVTKIVNDLERVGDEIKKVAYKAVQTARQRPPAQVRYFDVARAAGRAQEMLQLALDAFARSTSTPPRRGHRRWTTRSTPRFPASCGS